MLTLSKNLTFSLAIVTMLVLGFAFAPVALAHLGDDTNHGNDVAKGQHEHQGPIPEPDLSVTDVSEADGLQLELYTAIDRTNVTADNIATQALIDTNIITETLISGRNIEFYIRLKKGYALLDIRGADVKPTTENPDQRPMLHISDLMVQFYDANGAAITTEIDAAASLIAHRNTAFPDGRNFMVTIAAEDITANARYMSVQLPQTAPLSFQHADPVDVRAALIDPEGNRELYWNKQSNRLQFELVNAEPTTMDPMVVSIVRVIPTAAAATSRFTEAAVSGEFDVRVTFTEQPNFAMDGGNIKIGDLPFELENAKITRILKGMPFYLAPDAAEGNYADAKDVPVPTGRDSRYHPYLLTITPNLENGNDVVIRVKPFNDLVKPANRFNPPSNLASALNRSVLRVSVHPGAVKGTAAGIFEGTDAYKNTAAQGHEYQIPGGTFIPANGYLVIARGDAAMSGIRGVSADKFKDEDGRNRADNQTDFNFMHNVIHSAGFPYPGDDLDAYFRNGGTISVGYKDIPDRPDSKNKKTGYIANDTATVAAGDVIINEIMWGRDEGAAAADRVKSQWIELRNMTDKPISIDSREWVLTFGTASQDYTAIDTFSNAAYPAQQPGMGGVTTATQTHPVVSELVSMSRMMDAMDGTAAASWAASMRPSSGNFLGLRVGTPGGANTYVMAPAPTVTPPPPPVVTPPTAIAGAADIAISEIMYSVGRGNLPQWIELHNMSAGEVSLEGWNVEIENADGSDLTITLGATTADAGEAVLLISKSGRNSGMGADGADGEGDIRASRVVNLKDLGVTGALLSSTGFMITLSPPPAAGSSVRMDGDVAGGMDWDLPMMDGDRSSLIRETNADGTYKDGSMRMSWHPTSSTGRYGTYYGHPSDMGTPGYVMGGALPVELSMFYPARDKLTGQVVIKWETQSELNNAGFFVKRSTARTGPFTVINPTMIAGAGTTSEKQSYAYTDTSAKPNVLYFYQIEDVSLDGKRATLTNAHRLRGHIGVAGKATTIWGELKSQE